MSSPSTKSATTGFCTVCKSPCAARCQFPLGGAKLGQFCGRHLCGRHLVRVRDELSRQSFTLCAAHAAALK